MVALFAALIAPYFIDWTAYKKNFEDEASKIFGQSVSVGGNANVRLLPLPSVSFEDLKVGQNEDGSTLLSIGEFSANVELMPFLSGEIRVVDMKLDRPTLDLKVEDNGNVSLAARDNLKFNPEQVQLDKVRVDNGVLKLSGFADNKNIVLSDISADLTAKSLVGPWRVDGRGTVSNTELLFDVSTGRIQETGKIRVKADLRKVDEPYRITMDGGLGLNEGNMIWNGDFRIDPEKADNNEGVTYSSKVPLPVQTQGKFYIDPNRAEIAEFRSEIGGSDDPFIITGRGSINLIEDLFFRFQVDGRQIDIDRVANMRGEEAAQNIDQRIAIVKSVLEQMPVPNIDGEIDFEVPAIVAGDTVIREISALVSPFGNGWNIRRLNARLPGSTVIEADGRLGLNEDFGFDGHLLIASKQPSGFASWAIGRVDPTIRRLSSGGLEADVTFTQNQITFENMELLLGTNRLTGRMQHLSASTPENGDGQSTREALLVSIKGDVVQIEDLQAILSLTGSSHQTELSNVDIDASIVAKKLVGFDLEGQEVDLQFRISSGDVSVSKLNIGSFYGSKLSSTGQIVDLFTKPKGNLKLTLDSQNSEGLLALIKQKTNYGDLFQSLLSAGVSDKTMELEVEIDANPTQQNSNTKILLAGQVGGSNIHSQIGFSADVKDIKDAKFDVILDLSNEDPAILMRQLNLIAPKEIDQLIGATITGPLNVRIESVGSIKAGFSTLISSSDPANNISANGIVYLKEDLANQNRFAIDTYQIDITAGFENAFPYLYQFHPLLPDFLSSQNETLSLSLKGNLSQEAEQLKISNVVAKLDGVLANAELLYEISDTGRPVLSGNIDLEKIKLANLMTINFGNGSNEFGIQTTGWSTTEFGLPLFLETDAKIELSANRVDADFGIELKDAKTSFVMKNGEVELEKFIFGVFGGQMSGDLSLKNNEGNGAVQGQVYAENISVPLLYSHFGKENLFGGRLQFNGTFDGNGKSAKAIINSMTGSGVVNIEEGTIKGVSSNGLGQVLAVADQGEFEINDATVAPLVQEAFLKGQIDIAKESAAYSISRGKVQIRNLAHQSENFEAVFDGSASLVDGSINSSMEMKVDPGREKVSGATSDFALKWDGNISDPVLSVDTQSLQGFLSIRAFEAEQRRVELLQAQILEKQRLRRDIVKTNTRSSYREGLRLEKLRRAEEARLDKLRKEEAARLVEEARLAEERRKEDEAVRLAEEKRLAEEQAIREAEKEAERRLAEEAARLAEEKRIDALIKAEEARAQEELRLLKENEKQGFKTKELPPIIEAQPIQDPIIKNIEDLLNQNRSVQAN